MIVGPCWSHRGKQTNRTFTSNKHLDPGRNLLPGGAVRPHGRSGGEENERRERAAGCTRTAWSTTANDTGSDARPGTLMTMRWTSGEGILSVRAEGERLQKFEIEEVRPGKGLPYFNLSKHDEDT